MADPYDDFLDQYAPNLTPEQRTQFRTQFGGPAAPPAEPTGGPQLGFAVSDPDDPDSYDAWAQAAAAKGYPGAVQPPTASSNPESESAKGRGVWTQVDANDNAQRKAQAQQMVQQLGISPEEARQRAGVRAEPGEIGPPVDPRKGATFYSPEEEDDAATGAGAMHLVSKGGRTPSSWTTQTQQGLRFSPDTEQAVNTADASQRKAVELGRDVGVAEADKEAAYLTRHEQLQQERAVRLRRQADMQQQAYENELGKLADITDAVRADKIDPSALFTQNGVAGAFAASIAYVLGAVGGAITHTENPVIGVIRNEIDGQKANAALNRQKIEDQRGLLGQMAKTFGDERSGEEAAWMAYIDKAKTQIARIASESKSDWVRQKAATQLASLDKEWALHKEKWDELTQDKVMSVQHDVNAPPVYAGGPATKLDKMTREELGTLAKEREKAGIPEGLAALEEADRSIDTFGKGDIPGVGPFVEHVPSVVLGDEAVANRQAVAKIKNRIRKSIAGASLTDSEKAELNKELEGSYDAASLRRTVQSVRLTLKRKDQNLRAITTDEGNVEFNRRIRANDRRTVPLDRPSSPHVKRPE